MSYEPGDRIELVRDVDNGRTGQRGKVTSTAFFGGLDIELADGTRLVGVDASAVTHSPLGSSSALSGDTGGGCALVGLASGATAIGAAVLAAWARARWGA